MIDERDYALAVIQTVREPLVVLDVACKVSLANQAFFSMFGDSPDQIENRVLWQGAGGVWNEPGLRKALYSACAGESELRDVQVERVVPGRGLRTLLLNTRRILRTDHSPLLLLAIEDVTDARQAAALRVDAETLRLLDRRKDEFLGVLAHELRNPLASIRFALELLDRAKGNAQETARVQEVLERQVTHMVRIVDDLLDVSRITQGKVELRKEHVTLARVVSGAVELCKPTAGAARHTLTVSIPETPIVLDVDPVRIQQVLVNLLNNAVKFTPAGGHIWLIAETIDADHECQEQIRIRVRDTGIGIAPAALPAIFDMFMQGDLSLERTRGGLGVGLTLVRSLIALHGGSVEVRSEGPGTGSEFTVSLPLDRSLQPESGHRPSATAPARPLRVLVADDYDDGREMLSLLLTTEGHTVVSAGDGIEALAAIETFRPDVAILDIGMPGMSGYGVAEAVRSRPSVERVLLVALSGLGQREDKRQAKAAGFDAHFTKPVDIEALRAYLASV